MTHRLRYILVVFSIFIGASAAHAEEKIVGAFGMKLGDTFSPLSAIGKSSLVDGREMYQFPPQNPFRSLTRYYVLITPTTNKIYSIWGIGVAGNLAKWKLEQDVLMELLTQKYGPPNKANIFDSLHDTKEISQGNRAVLTKVTGFGEDATLEIRYYDHDIEKIAEKERLASEAKKAGGGGL